MLKPKVLIPLFILITLTKRKTNNEILENIET